MNNLFADIPPDLSTLPEEAYDKLLERDNLRIERIVSRGHIAPASGDWYDQDDNEWVVLLSGGARLEFADGESMTMKPGDFVHIPAGRKHRLVWTDPDCDSLWLAVHY